MKVLEVTLAYRVIKFFFRFTGDSQRNVQGEFRVEMRYIHPVSVIACRQVFNSQPSVDFCRLSRTRMAV